MPDSPSKVRRAWEKFRSWPMWVQVVLVIVVVAIIASPFTGNGSTSKKADSPTTTIEATTAPPTTEAPTTAAPTTTEARQHATTTEPKANNSHTRTVTKADFADDWPLTVDSGILGCQRDSSSGTDVLGVYFGGESVTYSVNGAARTLASKYSYDWTDIDPIWADDGSGLGLKKNLQPLIDAGLKLC